MELSPGRVSESLVTVRPSVVAFRPHQMSKCRMILYCSYRKSVVCIVIVTLIATLGVTTFLARDTILGFKRGESSKRVSREEGTLFYFFSESCPVCEEIREEFLLEEAINSGRVQRIVKFDTSEPDTIESILEVEREFHVTLKSLSPIMVYEGQVMTSLDEIRSFCQGNP